MTLIHSNAVQRKADIRSKVAGVTGMGSPSEWNITRTLQAGNNKEKESLNRQP